MKTYTQVSKENEGLLVGVFQWSLRILGYPNFDFQGNIDSSKIAYENNLADLFTKTLSECV